MGLPAERFIAANNCNHVVFDYLVTGKYTTRDSVETLANAMDVGAPSNFARILDLYNNSHKNIKNVMQGCWYSDNQIKEIVKEVYKNYGYICDPHGACGFQALADHLNDDEMGVFLETAHPAKFVETMEMILGKSSVVIPDKLAAFMKGNKESVDLKSDFEGFKRFLLSV
jgi:threonine synthase